MQVAPAGVPTSGGASGSAHVPIGGANMGASVPRIDIRNLHTLAAVAVARDKQLEGSLGKHAKYSLFVFSRKNWLRTKLAKLIENVWFERFILLVIIVNSIILALADFSALDASGNLSDKSWRNLVLDKSEPYFTGIFTAEAVIKIIVYGFAFEKGTYLRDGWNIMDFFVVLAALISLSPDVPNVSAFRTIRVVRPLRSLTILPEMQKLVSALLGSLPNLLNVVVMVGFALTMFAILGVQVWSGMLHARCRVTPTPVQLAAGGVGPCENVLSPECLALVATANVSFVPCLKDVPNDSDKWDESTSPWATPRACFWPIVQDNPYICSLTGTGDWQCPAGQYCGSDYDQFGNRRFENESVMRRTTFFAEYNFGYTGFDHIAVGLLTVFQVITMEGWTDIMYQLQDAHSVWYSAVFFIVLVLFGSYFLLNLTLAVIWDSFEKSSVEASRRMEMDDLSDDEGEDEETGDGDGVGELQISGDAPQFQINPSQHSLDLDGHPISTLPAITEEGRSVAGSAPPTARSAFTEAAPPSARPSDAPKVSGANDSPRSHARSTASAGRSSITSLNSPIGGHHTVLRRRSDTWRDLWCVASKHSYAHRLVMHPGFSVFVLCLILTNTGVLASDHYPIDDSMNQDLEMANFVLTILFGLEMVLKLWGLGPKAYAKDTFNLFDATIVVLSLVELALIPPGFTTPEVGDGGNTGAFSSLRIIRLFRVFKLARNWKSLQILLSTIIKTLADVANFAVLLLLFMYIFSLVGMQLFANAFCFSIDTELPRTGPPFGVCEPANLYYRPRAHFDDLLWAFVTVFQVLTGENWNNVMNDGHRAVGWPATLYFVALVVLGNFIVLNLFLAILLGNFDGMNLIGDEARKVDPDAPPKWTLAWFVYVVNGPKKRARRSSRRPSAAQFVLGTDAMPHDLPASSVQASGFMAPAPSSRNLVHDFEESRANVQLPITMSRDSSAASLDSDAKQPAPATSVGTAPRTLRSYRSSEERKQARMEAAAERASRHPSYGSVDLAMVAEFASNRIGRKASAEQLSGGADGAAAAAAPPPPTAQPLPAPGTETGAVTLPAANDARGDAFLPPLVTRAQVVQVMSNSPTEVPRVLEPIAHSSATILGADHKVIVTTAGDAATHTAPLQRRRSSTGSRVGSSETPSADQAVPLGTLDALTAAAPSYHEQAQALPTAVLSQSMSSVPPPDSLISTLHSRTESGPATTEDGSQPELQDGKPLSARVAPVDDSGNVELPFSQSTASTLSATPWLTMEPPVPLMGKSLFLLSPTNIARVLCSIVVQHRWFDNAMLVIICASSITLAIDNPLLDPNSLTAQAIGVTDIVFTIIFVAEMVLKVVTFGFLFQSKAYLRSGWNQLDFAIVVVSILSLTPASTGPLRSLRTVRTLRAFRPLRLVARSPELRLVVDSLLSSIKPVVNVLFVCLLFYLIFGIVGVNYFKGTFYGCQGDVFDSLTLSQQDLVVHPLPWPRLTPTQQAWIPAAARAVYSSNFTVLAPTSRMVCAYFGGKWDYTSDQTFDNIAAAMGTLFQISTTEGWADVMHAAVDSTDIDMQPIRDHQWGWALFFVGFIVVGTFFATNLFVGVVIDNFNTMKERLGADFMLTEDQKKWVQAQRRLLHNLPPTRHPPPVSRVIPHFCYQVVFHPYFEAFIMCCILLNGVALAATYFGESAAYAEALDVINIIFSSIFTVEAVLKLVAIGMAYFSESWNKFDLFVVIGSNVGIGLRYGANLDVGTIATLVRLCRVGRIFRLIRKAEALHKLFRTLLLTLPSLANIGALLFLLFFVYAVIGVQLFATVAWHDDIDHHVNFSNLGRAVLVLMRSATGEAWDTLMYRFGEWTPGCNPNLEFTPNMCGFSDDPNCIPLNGCGNMMAFPFFMSFTLVVTFVFLNLFIAVILEGFSDTSDGVIKDQDIALFFRVWEHYDPFFTGLITADDMERLIVALDAPLGFAGATPAGVTPRTAVEVRLTRLRLPLHEGKKVHISDVARALMGRHFQHAELPQGHFLNKEWRRAMPHPPTRVTKYTLGTLYAVRNLETQYIAWRFRTSIGQRITDKQDRVDAAAATTAADDDVV